MTDLNTWVTPQLIPADLISAKELVYDICNLICIQPEPEAESIDYSAYRFKINEKSICYRIAKTTPTKNGQFVTLWKRNSSGIIEPFDYADAIDFVIVSVRKENNLGQFIFPKSVLLDKGIFSTPKKEGKRAIRVYPLWDIASSKQAQKTQQWQLDYFLDLSNKETVISKTKLLFGIQ
ncbi:MepB family protein [Flavobacterium piscis]|uniref:MepB family protein n=1 Tax=Flavobacterium piscis TaxID=1114874 RepID=A0ABU1YAY2_9FLAO|nr:MepB family protein [Flavobacterium piscis]MDR7211400.1 hypothetical protein [Flavobacterium piscis]